MNQLEALALVVDTLESAQPHPVSTKHSDERQTPGVVIEDWNAEPVNYTGNKLYAGPITDPTTGDLAGREYHKYWNAVVDLAIETKDEVEGHNVLNQLQAYLLPLEDEPRSLHVDCHKLVVGPMSPKSLQFSPPEPTHTAVATLEMEYLDSTQLTLAETGDSVLEQFTNTYKTL